MIERRLLTREEVLSAAKRYTQKNSIPYHPEKGMSFRSWPASDDERQTPNTEIIVFSGDSGLAGAFEADKPSHAIAEGLYLAELRPVDEPLAARIGKR